MELSKNTSCIIKYSSPFPEKFLKLWCVQFLQWSIWPGVHTDDASIDHNVLCLSCVGKGTEDRAYQHLMSSQPRWGWDTVHLMEFWPQLIKICMLYFAKYLQFVPSPSLPLPKFCLCIQHEQDYHLGFLFHWTFSVSYVFKFIHPHTAKHKTGSLPFRILHMYLQSNVYNNSLFPKKTPIF